jgi:hypothetical protein
LLGKHVLAQPALRLRQYDLAVLLLLAKVGESGGWEPGIGDPTLFGWLAVFAYFGAAFLAYRAGRIERQLQPRSSEMAHGWSRLGRDALVSIRAALKNPSSILNYAPANSGPLLPTFWFALCGVMAFLGVNKQLDLQSCLTQVGRSVAQSGGWYEMRRVVQAIFVLLMALVGAAIVVGAYFYIRGAWQRYRIAFFGVIYLVTFVIIRAASFHHVDVLLKLNLFGLHINHVLELGGIGLIGYAAWRATRQARPPQHQAFEKTVRIR